MGLGKSVRYFVPSSPDAQESLGLVGLGSVCLQG